MANAMNGKLERILLRVQKPARYTGGEYNEVIKEKSEVDVRFAMCFPDTYEIGMSNLGLRILYGVMNEAKGVWCERVFAPWAIWKRNCARHRLRYMRWKAEIVCGSSILLGSR